MALFEVALDEQLEHHLKAAAQSQRVDQSEIVRQALAEYFRSAQNYVHNDDAIWDEWRDFSQTVIAAQRRAIIAIIRRLPETAWTSRTETRRS